MTDALPDARLLRPRRAKWLVLLVVSLAFTFTFGGVERQRALDHLRELADLARGARG